MKLKVDYVWYQNKMHENMVLELEHGRIKSIKKNNDVTQLKNKILFPGFVNCHSHAFQRGLRGLGEKYEQYELVNSFWNWRSEMYHLVEEMEVDTFYELCFRCFTEMKRKGITTVGEFHYFHHDQYLYDKQVLNAAKAAGIRIVLLNAYYEYASFGKVKLEKAQRKFETKGLESYWANMDQLEKVLDETMSLGVVAHSLRAVDVVEFKALHEESKRRNMVFHMHLEEQPKEVQDCRLVHQCTPMELVLQHVEVDEKFTAVHCTWTEEEQLEEFVRRNGNVCICPLTEGNLGDGFPKVKAANSNICIGSDCNARIDMLEELRWLEYAHRLHENQRGIIAKTTGESDIAKMLFKFATENGARSLQLPIGKIEVDHYADFMLVDLNHPTLKGWTIDSLLASMIFGTGSADIIINTCVHGKWDHPLEVEVSEKATKRERESPGITKAADIADRNSKNPQALACYFINIESLSGSENNMAIELQSYLQERGWQVTLQPVEAEVGNPQSTLRHNVYAKRPNVKNPKILFNSHIDTVPPYFPAELDGNMIRGRGACDTKSLIAAQLLAAQNVLDAGIDTISLLYVVSEETDHSGMKAANDLGLDPIAMIVGEPTNMKLIKLQKGILKVKVTSNGVAAHSGYPSLGKSAIDPLLDFLSKVKSEKWPTSKDLGDTTLNIGMIHGGQAANALAESASAMLMFRVTQDPNAIMQRLLEIANDLVQLELYSSNHPVHLGTLAGYETDVASFNTDIPYFQFGPNQGTAYLIGAGNITDAHCPREHILYDDLVVCVQMYENMVHQLLNNH